MKVVFGFVARPPGAGAPLLIAGLQTSVELSLNEWCGTNSRPLFGNPIHFLPSFKLTSDSQPSSLLRLVRIRPSFIIFSKCIVDEFPQYMYVIRHLFDSHGTADFYKPPTDDSVPIPSVTSISHSGSALRAI